MPPVETVKSKSPLNCTYPVALNLRGKFCTVVGGGEVALRKVKSLLAQGAEVTVISPQLHQELSARTISIARVNT